MLRVPGREVQADTGTQGTDTLTTSGLEDREGFLEEVTSELRLEG